MLSLSPPVGDLLLATWTPDGSGARLTDGLDEIASAAAERGAVLLGQRIYTAVAAARAAAEIVKHRGTDEPPTTVVGHEVCCRDELAGIHAMAVVGGPMPDDVRLDGQVVGRLLHGASADYLVLADPARVLRRGPNHDPAAEARRCLELAAEVLDDVGWSFSQVRRTWFYLRHILHWYDAFNDTRNRFFCDRGLAPDRPTGWIPASTGIEGSGPDGAWCTFDLLAVRHPGAGELPVRRLVNPRQNEAPEYGSAFARGLEMTVGDVRQLWISGTAAIDRRGRSILHDDPVGQVAATLDNIDALLGAADADRNDLCQATAFVKRPADIDRIRRALARSGLDRLHTVCTVADVCRDELLFELDATALVPSEPAG